MHGIANIYLLGVNVGYGLIDLIGGGIGISSQALNNLRRDKLTREGRTC